MDEWLEEYTIHLASDEQTQEDPVTMVLEAVRAQLAGLQLQQDTICEYLEKGVYTIDMFTKRNSALTQEIKQLQISEAELLRQQTEGKDYITAIDHLTCSIEAGELLVIVGESGSGKTSLIKSILGMMPYIEDELLISGIRIDDYKIKEHNIAFVRQEIALYPHLTIYENIAFPLRSMKTPQPEVDR